MEHGPQDHYSPTHYQADRISGAFKTLHPTRRYISLAGERAGPSPAGASPGHQSSAPNKSAEWQGHVYHMWSSRDNRKGRHAVVVSPELAANGGVGMPRPTSTSQEILRGLLKMVIRYPIWDVSYDVATIFTLGSVVWVINGFFEWLPLVAPSTEFNGEVDQGGGVTAFIGATIFVFGSVLLMLEAVNENRSDCFGWALEEAWEQEEGSWTLKHEDHCKHHHGNKKAWLSRSKSHESDETPAAAAAARRGNSDAAARVGQESQDANMQNGDSSPTPRSPDVAQKNTGNAQKDKRTWSWWPSWYELRTHYLRDIGFLACSSQMIGASIFWIAGLTGLYPILSSLSTPAENGAFWSTQVIGGSGFIVSGALFMLEVQEKWWKPALNQLGWHIGFWNLIGAIGFTACGALGYGSATSDALQYASTLSTFIGSWAFLVSPSTLRYYYLLSPTIADNLPARLGL
jgi:hypothetical protein